jgi:hypothetical protein
MPSSNTINTQKNKQLGEPFGQMASVLLQSVINMSCRTDLCQLIYVLLHSVINMSCKTDLCQLISVLLQSVINMSCRTDLCQLISVLLQSVINMSCRTDLCQLISVLLQTFVNSTKHLNKSYNIRFIIPWLGTGLLTATGETEYDKYEIRISQVAECVVCSHQLYDGVQFIRWISLNLRPSAEFIFSMPRILGEHVIPELWCIWTEIIDITSKM